MRRERAGRRRACTVAGLSSGNSTTYIFHMSLFFHAVDITVSAPGGQFYWSPLITTHLSGSYGSNGQLFFVYLNTRHTHPWAAAFTKKSKKTKNKSNIIQTWHLLGKHVPVNFLIILFIVLTNGGRGGHTGGEGKDTGAFFCGFLQS
ncbi:uncharacterized protein TrAFT101_004826 [Trichoderma asperellum]|uniref:uncharacterized protein n=1 Tax=Trichoderma asperellum TaxID=101201 RepID=UPI00332FB004|nr:hypothetical protein TrAFT101_004826 [Trichoderma asperellum]